MSTCPRRPTSPVFNYGDGSDDYDPGRGCNYCGSMAVDEFFKAIERGDELGPTDKDYKVYVGGAMKKFYFYHLNEEEKKRFIDLLNAKKIRFGIPGYFYVMPFFIQTVAKSKEPPKCEGS